MELIESVLSFIHFLFTSGEAWMLVLGSGLLGVFLVFTASVLYKCYCFIEDKEEGDVFFHSPWGDQFILLPVAGGAFLTLIVTLYLLVVELILPIVWSGVKWLLQLVMLHPEPLISVLVVAFILYIARYGRRTHKLLHKHMEDKSVHKENK